MDVANLARTGTQAFVRRRDSVTPEREKYLAKCSKREQQIRVLIRYYKYELKKAKAVCSSYDLKKIGRKPFGYRLRIGNVKQDKVIISALYHELARLKGMDRVVAPRGCGYYRQTGWCVCGTDLIHRKHNYCPRCGRRILW